jgi:hypothetical protein
MNIGRSVGMKDEADEILSKMPKLLKELCGKPLLKA